MSTIETRYERRYRGEHPLRTLLFLYQDDVPRLFMAVIYFTIKHSGVWLYPLITARVIDVVANPQAHDLGSLWFYAAVLVAIFVQNIPMNYMFARSLSIATRNMEMNLRSAVMRRLQHLSMHYVHRSSAGALQAKLLRDVEVIQELTRMIFETIPAAVFTMLFAIVVTAIRAPGFLPFFVLCVPVAALVYRAFNGRLKQQNRDFRQEVEDISGRLAEMVRLLPVTRAHGIERGEMDKLEQQLANVREAGKRLDMTNSVFGAVAWVSFRLFDTVTLITAAYVAYTRILPITVGDVAMLTGFFSNLTNSVLMITNIIPQISKGFESLRSIGDILENPDLEQNEGKAAVERVNGQFTLRDVSFTYPDTGDAFLNGVTLDVQAGETLAIVGASGSGKTTLLNLLIGFLRPTHGQILLDGVDMNTLDLRTYRRFLSVVSQETLLIRGTLRENILYGAENVSEAQLEQALRDANAAEFVAQLPDGLNTIVGENGVGLSGGQRQRIAIARALIRDPRVLILDEATSALDTASEAQIQQALERLMHGRTTFVVAHRLSTIRNAQRIIVMSHGRIVESGTHAELLARDGEFARMVAVYRAAG